jgi:hypothetical protein
MRARERVTESVLSIAETKICPRWPTCGREFHPASFDEDRVMSSAHATNTVVRIEAMAGNVRWPFRTASRSARRILMDARRFGTRQRVKTYGIDPMRPTSRRATPRTRVNTEPNQAATASRGMPDRSKTG